MSDVNFGQITKGIFTLEDLDDMRKVEKILIANGIHPEAVAFIRHTSLPKGHPKYMSQAKAAKKCFPTVSTNQTKMKALEAYKEFWRLLFFGTELEHYQQVYEARYKKESKPLKSGKLRKKIKSKFPPEVRAEKETKQQLNRAFRVQEDLGERGRLTQCLKDKFDRYLKEHYDLAYKKIIQEMQKEDLALMFKQTSDSDSRPLKIVQNLDGNYHSRKA